MCGIAGYFRFSGPSSEADLRRVGRMTDHLRHRGPDGHGLARRGAAVLGHRRLAIIDLSELGRQPMANEDGTVWLIFNGEIYNAADLRRELEALGHRFSSRTDSETILHGYEQWGMEGVLPRLRGMFAFALQDRRGGERVLLARDRFGIKPLYYHRDGEGVSFASEVRALQRGGGIANQVNPEAMRQFLLWGSLPEPHTTVERVFSLPAGAWARIDPDGLQIRPYYSLARTLRSALRDNGPGGLEVAVSETREILDRAVELHLISDAPLGLFLSGGIDSSALLALAAAKRSVPLTTLSVVFDESGLSEAGYAHLIAGRFGSDHRQVPLTLSDFVEELPHVFEAMDQPTIDGVNTYFVSRAAREAGLKVMLSGLGADETFLGYRHLKNAHRGGPLWSAFSRLPGFARGVIASAAARSSILFRKGALERASSLGGGSVEGLYHLYRGVFAPRRVGKLLGLDEGSWRGLAPDTGDGTDVLTTALTCREFDGYLKNQLLRDTDVMSMAHSLEVRVPYLDHILVEKVASTKAEWRLDPHVNKPLLVRALGESLPREVWDRPKMGFTLPFERWLKECRPQIREWVGEGCLERREVDRVWDEFDSGYAHWSQPWATVVASRWMG